MHTRGGTKRRSGNEHGETSSNPTHRKQQPASRKQQRPQQKREETNTERQQQSKKQEEEEPTKEVNKMGIPDQRARFPQEPPTSRTTAVFSSFVCTDNYRDEPFYLLTHSTGTACRNFHDPVKKFVRPVHCHAETIVWVRWLPVMDSEHALSELPHLHPKLKGNLLRPRHTEHYVVNAVSNASPTSRTYWIPVPMNASPQSHGIQSQESNHPIIQSNQPIPSNPIQSHPIPSNPSHLPPPTTNNPTIHPIPPPNPLTEWEQPRSGTKSVFFFLYQKYFIFT